MVTTTATTTTAARLTANPWNDEERPGRGTERDDRGPQVHHQHRAGMAVAELEQPVVQVLLVRGERRPARRAVRRTIGEQQVEERHGHHGERQQQRQQGRARGRVADGVRVDACRSG